MGYNKQPLLQIMRTDDWPDLHSYRISCECTDPSHDVDMYVSVSPDPDVNSVNLEFHVRGYSPVWAQGWNRFRAAWQLLTRGRLELENTVILSAQGARNVAQAITDSTAELEQHLKAKNDT